MSTGSARARRPRAQTEQKRQEILQAASETFGTHGYNKGSLVEIADKAGLTHAGVLHHFGSKMNLLLNVLEYRDQTDEQGVRLEDLPDAHSLFERLVQTVRINETRPGIVQTYAVLSAESVTEGHPSRAYFLKRFAGLRALVARAVREISEPAKVSERDSLMAASTIIGAMDGLQVQWLLDPDCLELAESTAFVIDAVLHEVAARAA